MPEVVALYKNNHDKLALSDVTGDDITDALAAYQALRADEVAAQQHLARVKESRLYYVSTAYGKLLEIYNRCQRVGRKDADIKRAIAGFEQIMKRMGRRKAAKPAPASSTTTTPPSTQPSEIPISYARTTRIDEPRSGVLLPLAQTGLRADSTRGAQYSDEKVRAEDVAAERDTLVAEVDVFRAHRAGSATAGRGTLDVGADRPGEHQPRLRFLLALVVEPPSMRLQQLLRRRVTAR